MNKAILAGGVAALVAAVAGGFAFAHAAPVAQDRPAPAQTRALRADADGDQRLSQAEFVNGRIERLTSADADRDGSVSPEEMRVAGEARRTERAALRFDRLDADNDGAISRTEFDAAREGRGDRRADRGPRPERAANRGHGGRHGDGARRMAARGPMTIAEAQAKATETFTRLDTDRDGYLTVEERRAGRGEMREHRRERRVARQAQQSSQQSSPPAPASE